MSRTKTVDILVCVDAESIVDQKLYSTDDKNPGFVPDQYFYYIASNGNIYAPGNNATGWQEIIVSNGDNIRWRPLSLTLQSEYTVLLYEMTGSALTQEKDGIRIITDPQLYYGDIIIPYLSEYNNSAKDAKYESENIKEYYHQITTQASTKTRTPYTWRMSIYEKGNLKGYIYHDPYMTIND
ncbi:AidA/PixA family protein [Photorhabdus antumapuensis]|uniref:AidA/PixA family protein n=1 Tax=Photorhabdus antumapuensis TaxID=2862867 RepID=UPI001CED012B|nr:AidA/PixA family protein [Photorhabdus antumapuensis]MCA6222602.1 inclusion body family protein [Photorhabdus antumapuensis]